MLKEIKNIIRTLVLTAGDSKDRSGRDVRFFFFIFFIWLHFVSLLHAFEELLQFLCFQKTIEC